MKRATILPFVLGVAATGALLIPRVAAAQNSAPASGAVIRTWTVPKPGAAPPFAFSGPAAQHIEPVEYRSEEEMSEQDRARVADATPLLREKAALDGFNLRDGQWSYRQIVCPALPNHILLLFTRDSGTRAATLLSAAIPRDATGPVRIVPVERRGFSLFSPASVNPITIAVFNRIRADEPASRDVNWLTTGLCYAALAGARPEAQGLPGSRGEQDNLGAMPPTLDLLAGGESEMRFVATTASGRPMEWHLSFSPKGRLLKASLSPLPAQLTWRVPAANSVP